jgi:hypothetical protein
MLFGSGVSTVYSRSILYQDPVRWVRLLGNTRYFPSALRKSLPLLALISTGT